MLEWIPPTDEVTEALRTYSGGDARISYYDILLEIKGRLVMLSSHINQVPIKIELLTTPTSTRDLKLALEQISQKALADNKKSLSNTARDWAKKI